MSRNYSSTATDTTLTGGLTAAATSVPVAATTGFPAAPFVLALAAGSATQELVLVTAISGLTLTVTRGYDSTVATTHDTGAVVRHSHAAIDLRESRTHEAATAAHGATGAVVGTTNTQTLTNKTLTAPAATGSLASFGGEWTAYTPTLGGATAGSGAVLEGRYMQIGKTVHFWARWRLGTNFNVTSGMTFSYPVPRRAGSADTVGGAQFADVGTTNYFGDTYLAPSNASVWVRSANGALGSLSNTNPFTWVANDEMVISGTYEAA